MSVSGDGAQRVNVRGGAAAPRHDGPGPTPSPQPRWRPPAEPGAPHRGAHPGAHAGHRRPLLLPSQTRRWQESERGAALPQTPTLGRRLPMHGGRCSHLRYRGRLTQRLRPTGPSRWESTARRSPERNRTLVNCVPNARGRDVSVTPALGCSALRSACTVSTSGSESGEPDQFGRRRNLATSQEPRENPRTAHRVCGKQWDARESAWPARLEPCR